jgi:hypothetical protein
MTLARRTMARWTIARWLAPGLLLASFAAFGHGVEGQDAAFLERISGFHPLPFAYLGAKHMVTGYDHLLFLFGVVFFLQRFRDVAIYVTLFAVGHSLTLLLGVLASVPANPWLVDAVIGLSVVYKGFDNLGGFQRLGIRIDPRAAVLAFGLVHGFGLATKLQALSLSRDGLVGNILAFNVGVEFGQFAALAVMLIGLDLWRRNDSFQRHAYAVNSLLILAGLLLFGVQLTGYFAS